LPLGALDRESVLRQLLPEVYGGYGRQASGLPQEKIAQLKSETMTKIGREVQFNPNQCIKLCNAEFPINPWYYFPLIRSGACEIVKLALNYVNIYFHRCISQLVIVLCHLV